MNGQKSVTKKKVNKPTMKNKEEVLAYAKAEQFIRKSPTLSKQSSACRRAWCEGFTNGFLYFKHLKPKVKWYEFWKK